MNPVACCRCGAVNVYINYDDNGYPHCDYCMAVSKIVPNHHPAMREFSALSALFNVFERHMKSDDPLEAAPTIAPVEKKVEKKRGRPRKEES